jgi:hypothetical protein
LSEKLFIKTVRVALTVRDGNAQLDNWEDRMEAS